MDKHAVHYSSSTDQHNTPMWLTEKIRGFLAGIGLDPCTDASNPTGAVNYYTPEHDGLAQDWRARTLYMNPPYGRGIGDWTRKLVYHYQTEEVEQAIALLPARTDTMWWNSIQDYPVLFLQGRLKFGDSKNSAPFPSALVYMGVSLVLFKREFRGIGNLYLPYSLP